MNYFRLLILLMFFISTILNAEKVKLEEAIELAKYRHLIELKSFKKKITEDSDVVSYTKIINHPKFKEVFVYLVNFKNGGFEMIAGDDNMEPYHCGSHEGKYVEDWMHNRIIEEIYKEYISNKKSHDPRLKKTWGEIRKDLKTKNKAKKNSK